MPRQRQNEEKVNLRLPEGMRTEIQFAAARNNRTANAEYVFRLQEYERITHLGIWKGQEVKLADIQCHARVLEFDETKRMYKTRLIHNDHIHYAHERNVIPLG